MKTQEKEAERAISSLIAGNNGNNRSGYQEGRIWFTSYL